MIKQKLKHPNIQLPNKNFPFFIIGLLCLRVEIKGYVYNKKFRSQPTITCRSLNYPFLTQSILQWKWWLLYMKIGSKMIFIYFDLQDSLFLCILQLYKHPLCAMNFTNMIKVIVAKCLSIYHQINKLSTTIYIYNNYNK